MNLEDLLSGLVVLLVILLICVMLSIDETPIGSTSEEYDLDYDLDYECCPKGTDLSIHSSEVLDCIYEGKHTVEEFQGSVPFAVKVYCNTGEILEY